MYPDIPFWLTLPFIAGGLWLLSWSANKFVDGSEAVAISLKLSPFVIGMVVIGFGTSAPELAVSALSAIGGHADLSLGNAYGSNTYNIGVILGLSAIMTPLVVRPVVSFVAVPLLLGVSVLSCVLVSLGGGLSRLDAFIFLLAFAILLPLYCWVDKKAKTDEEDPQLEESHTVLKHPWLAVVFGLALLVGSSHLLVWGAVDFARTLGVSELLIGLTVVAAGTSLPELASAIVSVRRGQHDFVLGNIIGSNFFNTLMVVGVSGAISPFSDVSPNILVRDLPVMLFLTLAIAIFGVNRKSWRENGLLSRLGGFVMLPAFLIYLGVMIVQEIK